MVDKFRFACDNCNFTTGDEEGARAHAKYAKHRVVDSRVGRVFGEE